MAAREKPALKAVEEALESLVALANPRPRDGRWIAYVRKSKDDNVNNISLQDQEGLVRRWATDNKREIVAVYSDVLSGTYPRGDGRKQRPGLEEAFRRLSHDATIVGLAVARVDRLGRNAAFILADVEELNRMGKNFASVEFQGLVHGPLNPTSNMAYMFLVLGALTAHTERSSYHGTKRAPLDLVIHEPEAEQAAILAPYLTKLDGEPDPQEAVKYLTEREGKERFAGRVLAAWKGSGM
ncbi:Resolvase, N terminal domain-containing protein [Hyaloraphidium curvatum]|nr:Resolvase, N terminal domain-containing protein [Hyaloraphidium curvatum]